MTITSDPRTGNDALIETALSAAEPTELEIGTVTAFRTLDGNVRTIDLGTPEYEHRLDRPARKTGKVIVRDVAAFVQYWDKHHDDGSEVYADLDAGTITAVLDAHTDGTPRWGEHRLVLQLTPTLPWRRWVEKDRCMLPQGQMADFIEDNLVDIDDEPVPAAQMLQVASTFQAATKGSFSSRVNLSSGARSLIFEEDTTATAGSGKQTIPVPERFRVVLAPFDDVPGYRIEARLRWRIDGGALKLGFFLDRPEDSRRDAVMKVVADVAEQIHVQIMRGTPA